MKNSVGWLKGNSSRTWEEGWASGMQHLVEISLTPLTYMYININRNQFLVNKSLGHSFVELVCNALACAGQGAWLVLPWCPCWRLRDEGHWSSQSSSGREEGVLHFREGCYIWASPIRGAVLTSREVPCVLIKNQSQEGLRALSSVPFRASIEEKYGKDLLNLSRKKPCGQSEIK